MVRKSPLTISDLRLCKTKPTLARVFFSEAVAEIDALLKAQADKTKIADEPDLLAVSNVAVDSQVQLRGVTPASTTKSRQGFELLRQTELANLS